MDERAWQLEVKSAFGAIAAADGDAFWPTVIRVWPKIMTMMLHPVLAQQLLARKRQ